jgi:hypothetical protein
MSRLRILLVLAAVSLFGSHSVLAADYAVGTCKPHLPSYSSISAAVAAVPSGSTVMVCPGTYAEQVTISQPLTLIGITSGNTNQAVITVPVAGLVQNVTSIVNPSFLFAAQVLVGAGPVNITNITVDGTGNALSGTGTRIAGIFYESGSSGVVNQVTTRFQEDDETGTGIWAENNVSGAVTIQNSSIHDFDHSGIEVGGSGLTITIKANRVSAATTTATADILAIVIVSAASGSVSSNTVTGPGTGFDTQGITVDVPVVTVTGNSVTNWYYALLDFDAGATYTSNTVGNPAAFGVLLEGTGATVQSNIITGTEVGVEFECNTNTVKNNTINDATFAALDSVPPGFSMANTFFNAAAIRTDGCDTAKPAFSKGVNPKRL